MFRRKENAIPDVNLEVDPTEEKSEIIERPQQSFSFGDLTQSEKPSNSLRSKKEYLWNKELFIKTIETFKSSYKVIYFNDSCSIYKKI